MNCRTLSAFILLHIGLMGTVFAQQALTPDQALARLMEGNKRFAKDMPTCPLHLSSRRAALATSQHPFAIVIGCSDSRLALSNVFDQSLGDIFAVRVAGNVVGPIEQESTDYAVAQLNVPLIMVLGHERCGAVKAVLDNAQGIPALAAKIKPAVDQAQKQSGDALVNATKDNVRLVVEQISATPIIAKKIKEKKVRVVGGYYNLVSGVVDLL